MTVCRLSETTQGQMRRFLNTCAKIPHFGMTVGGYPEGAYFATEGISPLFIVPVKVEKWPGYPIKDFGNDSGIQECPPLRE